MQQHTRTARSHAWLAVAALLTACTCCAPRPARAASLPEGLEAKPLLEQLLARKAYLAEHLRSDEWARHVQRLEAGFARPGNQAGLLIVAGGRDMFANAAITLRVLRGVVRSTVPVEIVHYGANELPPPEVLALITALNSTSSNSSTTDGGSSSSSSSRNSTSSSSSNNSSSSSTAGFAPGLVFVTDALASAHPRAAAGHHRVLPQGIKGFAAKVYAVTHVTRFKQVLLLDADSMPLIDPHLLFHIPLFQRSGSLFWPDLWHNAWVNETIYQLVGGMQQAPWVGKRHHRLVDSGQLLIDRLRHAEVLEYLWLLNSHHEWVYKHMHGDKDTFLLAFAMAERLQHFKQVPCFARDAMRQVPGHQHGFHHLGMVQSLSPAMLAAALRAAERAAAQQQGNSSARSSSRSGSGQTAGASSALGRRGGPARALLLPLLPAAAGASTGPAAGSGSGGSWQRQRQRRRLQQPASKHGDADTDAGDGDGLAPGEEEAAAAAGSGGGREAPDGAGAGAGAGAGTGTGAGTAPVPAEDATATAPPGGFAARRPNGRHIGVPAFFHRTSFNSKFFPDCLGDDKVASRYCEVQWVSVPLSNEQAGHSLKPNMYAFNADQIDTAFYQQHCTRNGGSSSSSSGGGASTGPASSWVVSGLGLGDAKASSSSSSSAAAAAGRGSGGGGGGARLLAAAANGNSSSSSSSSPCTGSSVGAQALLGAVVQGEGRQAQGEPPSHWWQRLLPVIWVLRCGMGSSGSCHGDRSRADCSSSSSSTSSSSSSAVGSGSSGSTAGSSDAGGSSSSRPQLQPQLQQRGSAVRVLLARPRQRRRRVLGEYGLPPEHTCDRLPVGEDLMPIPVMPVGLFQHMQGVLVGSYEAFRAVREALKL